MTEPHNPTHRLVWGEKRNQTYERGIDRGVLYPPSGVGVPWDGLISFDEARGGSAPNPVYFDGVKVNDISAPRDFSGTLKAYTFPDEFMECDGYSEAQPGFDLGEQMPQMFGLSYRTMLNDGHYRLHILYNLTATPANLVYSTINNQPTVSEFSWSVVGVPAELAGHRPTCVAKIDSRRVPKERLVALENILYGMEYVLDNPPRQPSLLEISNLLRQE